MRPSSSNPHQPQYPSNRASVGARSLGLTDADEYADILSDADGGWREQLLHTNNQGDANQKRAGAQHVSYNSLAPRAYDENEINTIISHRNNQSKERNFFEFN
jgi:hypothetical protein